MKIYQILISLCIFGLIITKLPFSKKQKNLSDEVHWAVLVAGSDGFWNYRHQSDVFHSYHVLINNGMNPDNIIVFAYDDIANNSQNPFPGKVFNKPDPSGPGVDVYANVKIDYKGANVTPQIFLNVIQGKKDSLKGIGSGRVLESNSTDNVFIYFSDHGATGLIAFPTDELYADQLNNALKNMHASNMYKKLVFYLEACESGSMFNNLLPQDINVYATTAATPSQSSWATYCSPDDVINKKSIGTCLGDEYSVNWIENSEDFETNSEETLDQQFQVIKEKTTHSQAQQYGDMTYLNETIGDFEGYSKQKENPGLFKRFKKFVKRFYCKVRNYLNIPCKSVLRKMEKAKKAEQLKAYKDYLNIARKSVVESRKVKVDYLLHKAESSNDAMFEDMLKEELEHIKNTDSVFEFFNKKFEIANGEIVSKINFNCLRNVINIYKNKCKMWGEYDLIYARNIAAACNKVDEFEINKFFSEVCGSQ